MSRRRELILLPPSIVFARLSLGAALVLVMVANVSFGTALAWRPDWVALCLLFWALQMPQWTRVSVVFAVGLVLDVHSGVLLGQHAAAYCVMLWAAIQWRRRVVVFDVWQQAVHVAPFLLLAHMVQWAIHLVQGDDWPSALMLLAPVLEAALWPVVLEVLQWPQSRVPDADANRPL